MFKFLSCFFLFIIYSTNSFTQPIVFNETLFCEADLLKHVKSLSSDAFEGRRTGSKGGIKAKKYIINQFYNLGIKPFNKHYEHSFTFSKDRTEYQATNVLGIIKGSKFSNKYIIISAHYDHEGIKSGQIFNGADDNASGVSALFAFAEYFQKKTPKHTVILAAFDAEELGLRGSKSFLNTTNIPLKNIIININMDMISRSNKNELFIAGTSHYKKFKPLISNLNPFEDFNLIFGHDGEDSLENWTFASDHANFHKKNIPFLYFGVEDHKDYHEPTDDYENIHPEFYKKSVRTIITVFEKIDKMTY